MAAAIEHERRLAGPRSGTPAGASASTGAGARAGEHEPLWRGLGRSQDLDVDLHAGERVTTVCALLAACMSGDCGEPAERESRVLALTLAGRIGALCVVVARTTAIAALEVELRCPRAGCGETFAVEVALADLRQLAADAERAPVVEISLGDAAPLRVRRPTGEDQRAWRRVRYGSATEVERAIVTSLLELDPPPPDGLGAEHVARIAAAMQERDPLPSFEIACRCVHCDAEDDHAIDLELELLRCLRAAQRLLLAEVHRLALRYGWTEAQTIALPAWRRRAYLDLIESQAP